MITCGNCFHYRRGRCKNKHAATYNAIFPSESQGCQMHFSRMFLPLGIGADIIAIFIGTPLLILGEIIGGNISISGGSGKDGFEI